MLLADSKGTVLRGLGFDYQRRIGEMGEKEEE